MAGLMDRVERRRSSELKRAGDAEHDPADLSSDPTPSSHNAGQQASGHASQPASYSAGGVDSTYAASPASEIDGQIDSNNASTTASTADGKPASISACANAGQEASATAGETASSKGSAKASPKVSKNAVRKASSTAGKNASRLASSTASDIGRPPRRRGRPRGESRRPITVRIRDEVDEAITRAVEDTGRNPQSIADDALAQWLSQRGYLPNADN